MAALLPLVALAPHGTSVLAAQPLAENSAFYGPSAIHRVQRLPVNYEGGVVVMDVDVGTPAQRLSLSVAGGYSGIALVQEPCDDCSPVFDGSASSTYVNYTSTQSLPFSSGFFNVEGGVAQDVLSITEMPSNNSLTLKNQTFTILTGGEESAPRFIGNSSEGRIGLGFGYSPSKAFDNDSLIAHAMSAGNLSSFTVGLDMNKDSPSTVDFGSIDRSNSSSALNFTWMPIFNYQTSNTSFEGDWLIELEALSFNGKDISLASSSSPSPQSNAAYIDPYFGERIWMPASIVSQIYSNNATTIPCDSQHDLSVTIGGRAFHLASTDLVVHNETDGTCRPAIRSGALGDVSRFGLPFLRSVYTAIYVSGDSSPSTTRQRAAIGFAQKSIKTISGNSSSPAQSGGGGNDISGTSPGRVTRSAVVLGALAGGLVLLAF